MQSNITSVDGHTLHYITAGDPSSPPILMIHGWASYHGVWRQTIPALQDDFYCVAIDLLGYGNSEKPKNGDYSIEAQGRRVVALADHLGFDTFYLIGHSMGGMTSLCIASMIAPERVNRLVDVSGVVAARLTNLIEWGTYPIVLLDRLFPLFVSLWRRMSHYRMGAKLQFGSWFYDFNHLPFNEWAKDRHMANQPGMHISVYESGKAMHQLDLTPHLPNISAPTLAIFGKHDAVVPVSDGHLVEEHVPDSQLILYDRCGHFPMHEKTDDYIQAVREFLLDASP